MPLVVGDGDQAFVDQFQVVFHRFGLPAEAEFEGVFEHQGQQPGGGLAAQDRAFEAGRQQPGYAAHVVDVHVGHQQGAHGADVEADGQFVGAAAWGGVVALEQAAVDQQAGVRGHDQFVAGTGDAVDCAVVENGLFGLHGLGLPFPGWFDVQLRCVGAQRAGGEGPASWQPDLVFG